MKILPLETQYRHKKRTFGSGQMGSELQTQGITSKTAQKLYSLDYIPVSKPREGYFLTYVFDKATLEPVDIYVKRLYSRFRCPKEARFNEEKYLFYRENPDTSLKLVGERWMTFDVLGKTIAPGRMDSMDKTLLGLGLREHQVGVERMLDLGFENIHIASIPEAYDFHKKAGFQGSDVRKYMSTEDINDFISDWSEGLKIRKNKIRKMLVYDNVGTASNEYLIFNENKTLENFLLYLKRKGREAGAEVCVKMELGLDALRDWEIKAAAKSIFHGQLKELR